MLRPGQFLLRHVATSDGQGGRLPICYDYSTADYCVAWEREIKQFVKRAGEWKQSKRVFVDHGTLDHVLMIASKEGADGGEAPELSAAPSATDLELKILNE